MTRTAMTPRTTFEIVKPSAAFQEALAEEMNGLSIQIDRARIPSGGGLAFELPGDDPESPELAKEITGVIIDHYPVNSYWREKYTGQNTVPDCFSMDGRTGAGDPGGGCETCPLNQFGSSETGDGKACRNLHCLFILQKGQMLPLALTLPPTSIRAFSNYLVKQVLLKGHRSQDVVTRISLKKVANASGIVYSQAQFAAVEVLSGQTAEAVRAVAEQLKPLTRRMQANDMPPIEDMPHIDAETGEILEER